MLPKWHSRYFHTKYAFSALNKLKGKVVDIGAGQGGITRALALSLPDLKFYACDNDYKKLEVFAGLRERIVLRRGDACNLPYKSRYFDAVVMFDVLEHLEDPPKAISEVSRVLKKQGVFHLVVPCEGDIWTIDGVINKLGINLKKDPIGHINQFTFRQVSNEFDTHGFKIKDVKYSYHFIYQVVSFLYFLRTKLLFKGLKRSI